MRNIFMYNIIIILALVFAVYFYYKGKRFRRQYLFLQKVVKNLPFSLYIEDKKGKYVFKSDYYKKYRPDLTGLLQFEVADKEGTFASILIDNNINKEITGQKDFLKYHDSLTELYNRNYLDKILPGFNKSKHILPLGVVMGDVNGLKLINDTYGHKQGDRVLKKAASILENSCRGGDIVIRWGGDEFLILLPKTSLNNIKKVVKRIKARLKSKNKPELPLSIAFGYALKHDKKTDIMEVINEAEDWMYETKLNESRSVRSNILSNLLTVLKEKSHETEEHSFRMQRHAFKIGEELGLTHAELDKLSVLVTLHDIGKVAVPDEILEKPGPLTEEEWEEVKKHSTIGYRIVSSSTEFASIAEEILYHHEHWDGSGYPEGLQSVNIPLLARITSIVDAYDVMRHGRPYKEPMSKKETIQELKNCAGSQFDPELVEIFLKTIE